MQDIVSPRTLSKIMGKLGKVGGKSRSDKKLAALAKAREILAQKRAAQKAQPEVTVAIQSATEADTEWQA